MQNCQREPVIICSEDSYIEQNRHPLKCDKNRQLPPAENEIFPYSRFSDYISIKFFNEKQTRKKALSQKQYVFPLEYYTDNILKQELLEIYGPMDECSKKFQLIFENYKEDRLSMIEKYIEEERQLFSLNEEQQSFKYQYSEDFFEATNLQDKFVISEIILFDSISMYDSVQIDPFLLPRPIKSEKQIYKKYTEKTLTSLTEFDPEISIGKLIIPEICEMNVGENLAQKMVEIVKKHPTGISNTAFLTEFKERYKYFPDAKSLNYLTFPDMMKNVGEHLIFIQDLLGSDTFYFPMCLQGLISTPQEMLFKILHKIKIVVNLHQGIVKVSKAMKFCRDVFGWRTLDVKGWGFENDSVFIQFLLDRWGDRDITLISETEFKPNGNDHVKYLVILTEKRVKFLRFHSSNLLKNSVQYQPEPEVQKPQITSQNFQPIPNMKANPSSSKQSSLQQHIKHQGGGIKNIQRRNKWKPIQIPYNSLQNPIEKVVQPQDNGIKNVQSNKWKPIPNPFHNKQDSVEQEQLQQKSSGMKNFPHSHYYQNQKVSSISKQDSIQGSGLQNSVNHGTKKMNPSPTPKTWSSLFTKK